MASIYDYLPQSLMGMNGYGNAVSQSMNRLPGNMASVFQSMLAEGNAQPNMAQYYANNARSAEDTRQKNITGAMSEINSVYNPMANQYQADAQNAYINKNLPKAKENYQNERKNQIYNQARSGNFNSSAGMGQMGNLYNQYNDNISKITQSGQQAGQQARNNVMSMRDQAIQNMYGTFNPQSQVYTGMANNYAATQPQYLTPTGMIFEDMLNYNNTINKIYQ